MELFHTRFILLIVVLSSPYFRQKKRSANYTFFYNSRSHPLHQDVLAYGCRYGLVFMVNISGKGRIIHKIRAHDEDIQGLDWSSETPEIFKGQSISKCLFDVFKSTQKPRKIFEDFFLSL